MRSGLFQNRFILGEATMLNRVRSVAVRLHHDDAGMETVQIIMVLAIAAMVCLGVSKVSGVGAEGANGSGIFKVLGGIASKFLPGIGEAFGM